MQGGPKRQVNAEDMLVELKRALESSTPAAHASPPSASTAPKSESPGRKIGRSQIDGERDRPVEAKASRLVETRTALQKSIRPSSQSWKLIGGGLGLAAAAAVGVSFALISKPSNLPEREPSVSAAEGLARRQTSESPPRAPMQDIQQGAPLQAGSLPAGGKAAVDAPNLAASGLETAPPSFAPLPLTEPATLVTTHRIGPDGAQLRQRQLAPPQPDRRLQWLERRSRRPRRPRRKWPSRTRRRSRPRRPLPPRPIPRRRQSLRSQRPPHKWSSRTRDRSRPRLPLLSPVIQHLLWLRRQGRRLRRPPRKWSSRIRSQLRQRSPPGLHLNPRRLGLRRRSRTQPRQHPFRANWRSHRSRRAI